jgi:hypothetical protein
MTPTESAHFGDDNAAYEFEKGVLDYVLSTFKSTGNSNFSSSWGWDTGNHFTSAVNGYNLKYNSSNRQWQRW